MKLNKEKLYNYFILSLCWYLAFYMLSYGYSKIVGRQFHVNHDDMLKKPIQSIDSFYLAWHLFGRSPLFNISIGLIQCICAILLIINRTRLIGALILLPVLVQIFIIDVSFTMSVFGVNLPVRLGMMIICDLLILMNAKQQILTALKALCSKTNSDIILKWWHYLILLTIGFLMDFVLAVITIPIKLLIQLLINGY